MGSDTKPFADEGARGMWDAASGASAADAASGASPGVQRGDADATSSASLAMKARKQARKADAVSSASVLDDDASFDEVSAATRWCMGRKRDRQVPLPGQSIQAAREEGTMKSDVASLYSRGRKGDNGPRMH